MFFSFKEFVDKYGLENAATSNVKTRRERLKSVIYLMLKERKTFFETLFCRKKSHSAEKIERGTLLVPFGFLGYLQKVKKMTGGTFGQIWLFPDLALGGFRIVSKKWTDQCEDCSMKRKTI